MTDLISLTIAYFLGVVAGIFVRGLWLPKRIVIQCQTKEDADMIVEEINKRLII